MKSLFRGLILFAFLFACGNIYAQKINLNISSTEDGSVFEKYNSIDSNSAGEFLLKFKDSLNSIGFLEAGVDSLKKENEDWTAYFFIGKKIEKASLYFNDETSKTISAAGISGANYSNIDFSAENIHSIFKKVLAHLENNGYPFASARLKVQNINQENIEAEVIIDRGKKIEFDSFDITGNAKVTAKFLAALTQIKPGADYNEKLVKEIDRLLRSLPFVRITQPTTILFINNRAKPMVYLEHRNSDFVDGILGFAPPASGSSSTNTKLLITGELRINLGNMFKGGQSLDANLRFFDERSQEFKIRTNFPYLFGSSMGLELSAGGTKFDTAFSQVAGRIGTSYSINGNDKVKLFFENQLTTLITVDTISIKSTKKLPANQSMSVKNYGIETSINRLNYIFNPQKGYRFDASISVGTKSIKRDNRIDALVIESPSSVKYNIYDSVKMNMLQYKYQLNLEKYTAVGRRGTILTGVRAEQLFSPNIYFNELIRFGGVYSLRGFNEQSLYATNYVMLTLEYRYLLAENENLFAFWNGAYYEDNSVVRTSTFTDYPFGFGLGANLQTGVGILTLAYAVGRENNNPLRFQSGKFHFGITGLF